MFEPTHEGVAATTFVWLVERGQPDGQAPTVWLDKGERASWYGGWTADPHQARQFASREKAEAYVEKWAIQNCRVTEHGFSNA